MQDTKVLITLLFTAGDGGDRGSGGDGGLSGGNEGDDGDAKRVVTRIKMVLYIISERESLVRCRVFLLPY